VIDLARAYRRTGADLPGSDTRPTHGAEMEGWFWRITDRERDRVALALCGINRHPDGDWATVAIAAHPGEVVRPAAVQEAWASAERFEVRAGDVLRADERSLDVEVGDARLSIELHDLVGWPHRFGAGGLIASLPWLGQYWQPHVLGGGVTGTLVLGGESWDLDGADVYAEKNWGAGFPERWWWGQAQAFDRADLCVAFGGGRLTAGPVGADVTGAVLRIGDEVVRFAPPVSLVRTTLRPGGWEVDARRPGWRMRIEGDAAGRIPAVLPVPLPAERRNVDRDLEHLAGRMRLQVWRAGRLVVDDVSEHAALEVGAKDEARFRELAVEHGVRLPETAAVGVQVLGVEVGALADVDLARHRAASPTYDHVGSTLGPHRPRRHERADVMGRGRSAFDDARRALEAWVPQRAVGARIAPDGVRPVWDETVVLLLGVAGRGLVVPTRIVLVVDEPRRWGYAYGTLPGHPEVGELLFLVEHRDDDAVVLTVRMDAVPARALLPVAPLVRAAERLAVARYVQAVRRAVTG